MRPRLTLLTLLLLVLVGSAWGANSSKKGKKGDAPYTVYPIPHEQLKATGTATFSQKVDVVAEMGIDRYTCDRAQQILTEHGLKINFEDRTKPPAPDAYPSPNVSTVYLGLNGSGGMIDRLAKKWKLNRKVFALDKYDRHVVALRSRKNGVAEVIVLGENTDAVFCGLATLEQMLDQGTKQMPCVTFYDYADVQNRGIIEGYYGVPYSMEVTADLFRFMARYKLNMYMYGAKSDPYHSRYWDKAYPEKINNDQRRLGLMTQDMLRHLCDVAHQSKVNFIWAIHPGQNFTNAASTDVIDRIMSKFEQMHALGVRQFGVFVDDVGVPNDEATLKLGADRLTTLQQRIDQRWNKKGAASADTVKPLHYVPQLYAFSWVKPDVARRFWEALRPVPEKVNLYITGRNVWSVPNNADLEVLDDYLGREVSWWWNYPCNDNDVTKIFPADTYTNFLDETHIVNTERLEDGLRLKTLIINPMQQGELSKIALFSVADYAWNMATFDNMKSWEASLSAIVGKERMESFETLVPHLRYYDELAPLGRFINEYKKSRGTGKELSAATSLLAELERIGNECDVIAEMADSNNESDRLFYADLRPWLLKLKAMTEHASVLIRALEPDGDMKVDKVTFAKSWSAIEGLDKDETYQFDVLTGMDADIALSVRTAEPSARLLRPFLDWLLKQF